MTDDAPAPLVFQESEQNLRPIGLAIDRLQEALEQLAYVQPTDLMLDDQGVANFAYQQIVIAMRLLGTVGR